MPFAIAVPDVAVPPVHPEGLVVDRGKEQAMEVLSVEMGRTKDWWVDTGAISGTPSYYYYFVSVTAACEDAPDLHDGTIVEVS